MMTRNLSLVLLLILISPVLRAQRPYLQLNHKGFKRDIEYFAGDNIVFRMKDEKFNRHDKIKGFTDSSIVFESYQVLLRDLKYVRYEVTHGFLSPSNGPKLIIAGFLLTAADYINYSLIRGNTYKPDKELYIVAGSMIVAGGVLMTMRYRNFRPGVNRKIVVKDY